MTDNLPWTMSGTLVDTRPADPREDAMNVVFADTPSGPWRILFRKCCPCMCLAGRIDRINADGRGDHEAVLGENVEFICGCGAHPSVMVCDGKVVGTSA
jgi:hypothetical protein